MVCRNGSARPATRSNRRSRKLTGHLAEARIGAGTGIAYIGHNRLRVTAEGKVSWFERNPTQIPTAPVDPTVTVVRVDTVDRQPLAIVVNYACHPVVFGADNFSIRRIIRRR